MKIAICTPLHGDPREEYTKSIANLCLALGRRADLEIRYILAGHSLVQAVRTELVAAARHWGADYLLFIDADHGFPPDALFRLLAHKTAIVATNYPRRHPPHLSTAFGLDEKPLVSIGKTGLEEVLYAGLGLCLLEMAALQSIEGPLFDVEALPGGRFVGEDYFFCERVRKAGFHIMVDHDLSLRTTHVTTQILTHRDSMVGMAQAALSAHKATETPAAGPPPAHRIQSDSGAV